MLIRRALFLHGGPGMSSAIERLWYSDQLPVLWWDQPTVADSASPFDDLVRAAAVQLSEIAASQGPVHLLAHSFGGQLAYALSRQLPELIERITLLGCPINPLQGMLLLVHRIAEAGRSRTLAETIATAGSDMSPGNFAAMMTTAACDPAYLPLYFGPASAAARDRFVGLLQHISLIDLPTFFAVMNEFLTQPTPTAPSRFGGAVEMLLGRHDPCLWAEVDVPAWTRVFPQLHTITLDVGHIVHLEAPPEVWCFDPSHSA